MLFEELIGNETIKNYLKCALNNKTLSSTLLFSGISGIGKKLFALNVAASLMYPDRISFKDLKRLKEANHPDLRILRPENNFHTIASMRLLIDEINLVPFETRAKVFIIEDAEKMQAAAANAILKTLEEPPESCYIILLTSSEKEMLSTVVSRCFKVRFYPLKEGEIALYLEEKRDKSESVAKRCAALSRGSLERALELAEKGGDAKKEIVLKLVTRRSYFDLNDELSKLEDIPIKEAEEIFDYLRMWFRDLYLLKVGIKKDLYFADSLPLLREHSAYKTPSLYLVEKALLTAHQGIERNIRLRSVLENFFLEVGMV